MQGDSTLKLQRFLRSIIFFTPYVFFLAPIPSVAAEFDFSSVVSKAKSIANEAYEAPAPVPEFLTKLDFEQWKKLQFKVDKALWRAEKLPFEAQFFHPGYNYEFPVRIHVLNSDDVRQLEFSRDDFSYPTEEFREKVPRELGFSGFRLHYPINREDYKDEIAVFLGASYMRGLGKGQSFGLSARGLAIDTGVNGGEEFPHFREFWLVEPTKDDANITIYALLDSPSVAGAYRIVIAPGETTTMDVDTQLFPRKKIAKLGIAPLTSMYMYGENDNRKFHDYRPEVHDSDGLLLESNDGEWLWRPLQNPASLAINSFSGKNLRSFGLMQRDRNFDHYQDLDQHYESRPSAWVQPRGEWGQGRVELVQIPSDSEMNDNVVSYWVPQAPVTPEKPLHFEYRLNWQTQSPEPPGVGKVIATRIGVLPEQSAEQSDAPDGTTRIVVDFAGGQLSRLPKNAPVDARVTINDGVVLRDVRVRHNENTGGWRLSFDTVSKQIDKPLELRAFLVGEEGDALTQTWSYTSSL